MSCFNEINLNFNDYFFMFLKTFGYVKWFLQFKHLQHLSLVLFDNLQFSTVFTLKIFLGNQTTWDRNWTIVWTKLVSLHHFRHFYLTILKDIRVGVFILQVGGQFKNLYLHCFSQDSKEPLRTVQFVYLRLGYEETSTCT